MLFGTMRKQDLSTPAGLFLVLSILVGQMALAQEAPPEQPPQVPTPTPLSEIALKTEQSEGELADIQGSLEPAAVVEAIAEQLVTLDKPLAEGRRALGAEQLSLLSLRDLGDLQQDWGEWQHRIEGWESQVESRAQELESARDQLTTMQSEWQRTRESVGDVEIPPELSARIALVVAKHEETTALVAERLSAVLSLQAELAEQAAAVRELLGDIGRGGDPASGVALRA